MRYIIVASVRHFELFKTHIYPLSAEKKRWYEYYFLYIRYWVV